MSKPESYYSIEKYDFINKKTKETEKDWALLFYNDLVKCEYTWGRYKAKSSKPIRLMLLKELAKTFDDGATEDNCGFVLKQNNLNELTAQLKQNEIAVIDFFKWISENLPEEEKKQTEGTRTVTSGITLASIINKMANNSEDENFGSWSNTSKNKDIEW